MEEIETFITREVEPLSCGHFRDRPYQTEACRWMLCKEKRAEHGLSPVGGGVLADEVGLGKTFMTAGLIVANRLRHTLIVTPTSCQTTWIAELNNFDMGLIEAFNFPDRAESLSEACVSDSKCVCVVSTYHQVQAQPKWMVDTCWDRIVLDEGHFARNPKTSRFRTLKTLSARHRWVLSATPIHNSIRDMLTLLDWVGVDVRELVTKKRGRKKGLRNGAANKAVFNDEHTYTAADIQIDQVVRNEHEDELTMDARGETVLNDIISQHVMRRTLDSEKHRAINLQLPYLEKHVEYVKWNSEFELELYESVRNALGKQLVSEQKQDGGMTRQRNRNITIEAITRLRQICASFEIYESSIRSASNREQIKISDWQELVQDDDNAKQYMHQTSLDNLFFSRAVSHVEASDDEKERIDEMRKKKRRQLYEDTIHPESKIPYRMLIQGKNYNTEDEGQQRATTTTPSSTTDVNVKNNDATFLEENPVDKFESLEKRFTRPAISSKMSRVCELVREDCTNPDVTKIVVFTSFLEEMNILSDALAKEPQVETRKLYGGMDMEQRNDLLELFRDSGSTVKVLIAQIMCSSTGINLQCANRVYITCPTWNPCTETQAIGRVYRQLQKHPVKVVQFAMEDTIESKCLETQKRKCDLIQRRLPKPS